ncbi:MAG: hypothetical protein ACYCZF_08875 [Anaerolineae bacterium]
MNQDSDHVPQVDCATRAVLTRHAAWWEHQGLLYAETPDGGLGDLWLPLADGHLANEDVTLSPEMLDVERLVGSAQRPGKLQRYGDIFQTRDPYTRVPWVEAIIGCPIRASFHGGAMRAQRFVQSWQDWPAPNDSILPWLELLQRLTNLLVARSGGQYAVAHTLMRGPSDLAEAALGAELMCLSQYDHPTELTAFLESVTTRFLDIWRAQWQLTPPIEGGYVNPFGIWAPGTVVRTQCDASALLSPAQYRDWYLPYDKRISEAADYAVIHLHSGSLHTVESLLPLDKPQAIQVSLDPQPSGPPLERLLPIFGRILQVKSLIVDGVLNAGQVQQLLEALPANGLCIIARGDPENVAGL